MQRRSVGNVSMTSSNVKIVVNYRYRFIGMAKLEHNNTTAE